MLKLAWWKWLCIILMVYTVVAGFLMGVPRLPILNETIRNQHFHVTMWFAMILLLVTSLVYSIRYLAKGRIEDDIAASQSAYTAVVFGVLGLVTGSIWATYTWGEPWSGDPKQNSAAIGLLMYLAYAILRGALPEQQQRGRISAIYNIFAFAIFIPLIFILPRLKDSLHPGNGGNPGFSAYDLDARLRAVFYPAVIGWTLLGWWITTLRIRYQKLINTL